MVTIAFTIVAFVVGFMVGAIVVIVSEVSEQRQAIQRGWTVVDDQIYTVSPRKDQ